MVTPSDVQALERAIEAPDTSRDIEVFLVAVAEIGRGDRQSPEAIAFLRAAAPVVSRGMVPLRGYVFDLEHSLAQEFWGDEWFSVCERRSRIEFVRDMFRDLVDVEWDTFLDVENVDYMLRGKGDHEGGGLDERIPTGTPVTHWWWWYPQPAPNA